MQQKAMAGNQKVHANCVNASNPFHKCSVTCLEKIAAGRKQDTKKLSSILSFGKKKKGHDSKATTPRQEIDSQPLTPRKELDSQPVKPQSLDDVPTKVEANAADISSPRSHFSFHDKKTESYSSIDQEISISSRDQSFNKDKVQSSTSENVTDEDPENASSGGNNGELGRYETVFSSSTSGVLIENHAKDNVINSSGASDNDDEDMYPKTPHVLVGKYKVKESSAAILQSIFEEHGDIAANCNLESTAMVAYYLEFVCSVEQELRFASYSKLSKSKVKGMVSVLKDIESANIKVGWLHDILGYVMNFKDLMSEHQEVETQKAKCEYIVKSKRKELDSLMELVGQKEKELSDAQAIVEETRATLSKLEAESAQLSKNASLIQSKVETFHGGQWLEDRLP